MAFKLQTSGPRHWPAWASNFARLQHPIRRWGCEFWTVEAFFQAAKTEDSLEKKVISTAGPRQAKALGRACVISPTWEQDKIPVMLEGLLEKFAPGTEFRKALDATVGIRLVETNKWHDNFWGDCTCSECAAIEGQNILGRLLCDIRDRPANSVGFNAKE